MVEQLGHALAIERHLAGCNTVYERYSRCWYRPEIEIKPSVANLRYSLQEYRRGPNFFCMYSRFYFHPFLFCPFPWSYTKGKFAIC